MAPQLRWVRGGGGGAAPPARSRACVGGGGGGIGGGPLVPWRCLLSAEGGVGGGMAVLAPGASHRLGGRALPPPPSTESRILAQALAGAPHPPAVVARITDLRTLSWSSGAAHPPGGTSRFPPSLRRSTASKGRFLDLLEVPWVAQHNHPYTSPTRGRVSSPRGTGTAPQSRSHGRPSSAPRAGPPRCPCACGADAAPRPPSA